MQHVAAEQCQYNVRWCDVHHCWGRTKKEATCLCCKMNSYHAQTAQLGTDSNYEMKSLTIAEFNQHYYIFSQFPVKWVIQIQRNKNMFWLTYHSLIFFYARLRITTMEVFCSNNTNFGQVGSFTQGGSGSSFEKIVLQQLYYSGLRHLHWK